jgi:hypothetical protein
MSEEMVEATFNARYMVFYYLTPTGKPCHPDIKGICYHHGGTIQNPEALIDDLISAAREGTLDLRGTGISSIPWRHKSYLAIVLEGREYTIDRDGGLTLEYADGGNHSFENIRYISPADASGAYCENHFRKENGRPWDLCEQETFGVDLQYADRDGHRHECHRSHNESGTNTGPPIP